jgi:hypothetical protein
MGQESAGSPACHWAKLLGQPRWCVGCQVHEEGGSARTVVLAVSRKERGSARTAVLAVSRKERGERTHRSVGSVEGSAILRVQLSQHRSLSHARAAPSGLHGFRISVFPGHALPISGLHRLGVRIAHTPSH